MRNIVRVVFHGRLVLSLLFIGMTFVPSSAQWNSNSNSELYSLNSAVGIGVTDPSAKFEIRGGTDGTFLFIRQDKNSGGSGDVVYFRDDRGYAGNNTGTTFKIESWRGDGQKGGALVNFATIGNGFDKSRFFINNDDGFVGLGTASPRTSLQVDGTSGLQARLRIVPANVGSTGAFDIIMGSEGNPAHDAYAAGLKAYVREGQPGIDRVSLGFYTTTYASGLQSRVERMTITDRGNIGIGTTNPDAKLAVKGDIHTTEVRVDLTGSMVPDYVFESDYELLSLAELKTYVNENRHLPEVPSAGDMQEDGLNLKEMNLLLLKKVEELTLHLISQNEINLEQARQIKALEARLQGLSKSQLSDEE